MPKPKQTDASLVVVLGDQLDLDSTVLQDLDRHRDRVWMAEARDESTHLWSSKIRIACFLAAMRHFRDALVAKGFRVTYQKLDPKQPTALADILVSDIERAGRREMEL